jgi:hypothetical protein
VPVNKPPTTFQAQPKKREAPLVNLNAVLCVQLAQARKEVVFSRAMLSVGRRNKMIITDLEKAEATIEYFERRTENPNLPALSH